MSNLDRRPAPQELGGLEQAATGPVLDLLPGKEVLLGESTRVRRLLPTRRSLTSIALVPFAFPPIWLFTKLAVRRGRRRFLALRREGRILADAKPPHDEMVRHVLSAPLLLDRVIAIEAEAV